MWSAAATTRAPFASTHTKAPSSASASSARAAPRRPIPIRNVRAAVAADFQGAGAGIGDGVYDSDEVVTPLSSSQQEALLTSLRADLENSYAEGFTFTPFAVDMTYADPLVHLEGRTAHKVAWALNFFTVNQMLAGPEHLIPYT